MRTKGRLFFASVALALGATGCSDDGAADTQTFETTPSTGSRDAAVAMRKPNSKWVVSCDQRSRINECHEWLSDEGTEAEVRDQAYRGCDAEADGTTLNARCPTEGAIAACVGNSFIKLRAGWGGPTVSIRELYYPPLSEENTRVRCTYGTYEKL